MIFRFDWFVATWFSIAISASLEPSVYRAIAIFLAIASIWLLPYKLKKRYFNWQKGEVKRKIALASLIIICLIIPQVETDLTKFSIPSLSQING